jgi:hypothetical protein
MIQPLSGNAGLLQSASTQLGGSERIGEAEHDGDSDDAGAGSSQAAAMKPGAAASLPSYLGNVVDTQA